MLFSKIIGSHGMNKFNIIFCVLTYKNQQDLLEFIESLENNDEIDFSYKIIVINNYADESSLIEIKKIATSNNCDFLENENKGYSHGNNLGIAYANTHYEYDYIVVCNADTKIKQFKFESLNGYDNSIIAPEIICLNGKRQNPMHYKYMPLSEKIVFSGYKNRRKYLIYTGVTVNKLNRFIYNYLKPKTKSNSKRTKIYACHGSYIIFSKNAINKLFPVFDENIFLFCEESDLAKKANSLGVDIIFNKDIVILHKEDGSMSLSNSNLNDIQRESYLYYYKKWNTL
jgi:GT2 family glycosyltransferase